MRAPNVIDIPYKNLSPRRNNQLDWARNCKTWKLGRLTNPWSIVCVGYRNIEITMTQKINLKKECEMLNKVISCLVANVAHRQSYT